MAQFRATIQGQRGVASRLGSKKSGLEVTANGWGVGVRVSVRHSEETGQDIFCVYKTQGSGYNAGQEVKIAEFTRFEDIKIVVGKEKDICQSCQKDNCEGCLSNLRNL